MAAVVPFPVRQVRTARDTHAQLLRQSLKLAQTTPSEFARVLNDLEPVFCRNGGVDGAQVQIWMDGDCLPWGPEPLVIAGWLGLQRSGMIPAVGLWTPDS